MIAVGPFSQWGHLIQLTLDVCLALISLPLNSLTVEQQSDNALIAEIKICLLPSIKRVVNGEVVWGLERVAVRLSGGILF